MSGSYGSKVTLVGLLDAEEIAEAFLLYVFIIAFTASLFQFVSFNDFWFYRNFLFYHLYLSLPDYIHSICSVYNEGEIIKITETDKILLYELYKYRPLFNIYFPRKNTLPSYFIFFGRWEQSSTSILEHYQWHNKIPLYFILFGVSTLHYINK